MWANFEAGATGGSVRSRRHGSISAAPAQKGADDVAGQRLVVDVVRGDHAITIGGNLGGTVSRRKYPLDPDSRLVVAQSQLYTQEANSTVVPPWPATSTADLHGNSTARFFALLSPVPSCVIVPGQLFGGPAV
jgi:hypothetical protein